MYTLCNVCFILLLLFNLVDSSPRHHQTNNDIIQIDNHQQQQNTEFNEQAERDYVATLDLPEYWMPTILHDGTLLIESTFLADIDKDDSKHNSTPKGQHRHHKHHNDTKSTTSTTSRTHKNHTQHATEAPSTQAPTEAPTTKPAPTPKPKPIEVRNNRIYVNGEPFNVQGVCYSPVPIGESVNFKPMGDYFTPDYAYIWQRDLPLMKAMGATVIRIYGK